MTPSPAEWAGLCARSESDQPHEWPYLVWVIRNRVEARAWPGNVRGVVTQPWQFSYFNKWRSSLDYDRIWHEATAGYAGDSTGWADNDLDRAVACAADVLERPRWQAPFSHRVYHFWSPVSMDPQGSDPSWAERLRVFEVSGVDPWRFKFAES